MVSEVWWKAMRCGQKRKCRRVKKTPTKTKTSTQIFRMENQQTRFSQLKNSSPPPTAIILPVTHEDSTPCPLSNFSHSRRTSDLSYNSLKRSTHTPEHTRERRTEEKVLRLENIFHSSLKICSKCCVWMSKRGESKSQKRLFLQRKKFLPTQISLIFHHQQHTHNKDPQHISSSSSFCRARNSHHLIARDFEQFAVVVACYDAHTHSSEF